MELDKTHRATASIAQTSAGATDVRFYDFKSDGRETQLITEVTVNKLIPAEPVIILWSPIPGNAAPESGR